MTDSLRPGAASDPPRDEGDPGVGLSHLVDALSLNKANTVQLERDTSRPTSVPRDEADSPARVNDRANATFVLFQPACSKHRYIRNHHDVAEIVERPERIRAIKAGVAAAWARHENASTPSRQRWTPDERTVDKTQDLESLMGTLSIGAPGSTASAERNVKGGTSPFDILVSDDQLSLESRALQLVHGASNYPPDHDPLATKPPVKEADSRPASPSKRSSPRKPSPSTVYPSDSPWPKQLVHLIDQVAPLSVSPAANKVRRESEIPSHLPQGDLYLCPESKEAIFGALGAVCRGVDLVSNKTEDHAYERGFVVVRPPGHHCGEANPQGFCWVNNVAVAAAHAHLEHGINRVVILDIDLHHGNGTQEIVWRINEKANDILVSHRERCEARKSESPRRRKKASSPAKSSRPEGDVVDEDQADNDEERAPRPLQIMYSSLHDVLSYPCESGDASMIAAASIQISGPHSQYIHNTHLERYESIDDFRERLWPKYWDALGGRPVERFLDETDARDEETLILVSAGFDASTHEYPSMSRHGRNVPACFYSLFSSAIEQFAQRRAQGKLVFVLEGGYSDRALVSGSMGILRGLMTQGSSSTETAMDDHDENVSDLERVLQVCRLEGNAAITKTNGLGRRRGGFLKGAGKVNLDENDKDWIKRTKEVFEFMTADDVDPSSRPLSKTSASNSASSSPQATPLRAGGSGSRQLRERKVRLDYAGLADVSIPTGRQAGPPPQLAAVENIPQSEGTDEAVALPIFNGHGDSAPVSRASSSLPPAKAFASVPAATFYPPIASSSQEAEGVSDGKKKPAIKFVWKQGGIGGGGSTDSVQTNGSEMGPPRM